MAEALADGASEPVAEAKEENGHSPIGDMGAARFRPVVAVRESPPPPPPPKLLRAFEPMLATEDDLDIFPWAGCCGGTLMVGFERWEPLRERLAWFWATASPSPVSSPNGDCKQCSSRNDHGPPRNVARVWTGAVSSKSCNCVNPVHRPSPTFIPRTEASLPGPDGRPGLARGNRGPARARREAPTRLT